MAYFGSVVTSRKSAVRKRVDINVNCDICSNVKFVVSVRNNLLLIRFVLKYQFIDTSACILYNELMKDVRDLGA